MRFVLLFLPLHTLQPRLKTADERASGVIFLFGGVDPRHFVYEYRVRYSWALSGTEIVVFQRILRGGRWQEERKEGVDRG
jgi:hypothetical protein